METLTLISSQEYLAQERTAETKSEYHAGEVFNMAGAQLPHNRIVRNLVKFLDNCLEGTNCEVLANDMLVELAACERYVYPDVVIVCEEPQLADARRQGLDVLVNPTVVIEVTSPSTALFDRTEKMACYMLLASLQQYVLIDSEKIEIITYTRTPQNQWLMQYFTQKTDTALIGECPLLLADIYRKVGF